MVSDTAPDIEKMRLEAFRQMSPQRKMQLWAQLNEDARAIAMSGLRQRYPNASPAELRRRLAGLLYGEALATAAYGPLPDSSKQQAE